MHYSCIWNDRVDTFYFSRSAMNIIKICTWEPNPQKPTKIFDALFDRAYYGRDPSKSGHDFYHM